jgi:leader peptidase (prepilin peptidase) / N-methyltransferase
MVSALDFPWLAPILMSPIAGSFVGVLIRRLPNGQAVAWARSQCESCHRSLTLTDLVPIASYLALRGRCATCRAPIAPFHLAIELAAVAVAVWAATVNRDPAWLWTACLLGWGLLALGWIDAEHMRLPNALTLPLLVAGIATQTMLSPERFADSVLGAALGYLGFRAAAIMYRLIRGREGLGGGDAKLLSVAGAWVGWAALPDVVLLAAVLGLGLVAIMHIRGRTMDRLTMIPFGPCLALALWIVYLYGAVLFGALGG